jgi:RHS repeat-associated protein
MAARPALVVASSRRRGRSCPRPRARLVLFVVVALALTASGSPLLVTEAVAAGNPGQPPPERIDENARAKEIAAQERSKRDEAPKRDRPREAEKAAPPPVESSFHSWAAQGPDKPEGWKLPDGEIPRLRTETSKTYDAGDGKLRTEMGTEPIHVREPDGKMVPIDDTLELASDGRLRNRKGRNRIQLGRDGADESLASLELDDQHAVGFSLRGSRTARPERNGNHARYADIQRDTDLELSAEASGVKESVILKSRAAPNVYEFPLSLKGLTARIDPKSEAVELRDGTNKIRAYIPPGLVADSSTGPMGHMEPDAGPVRYRLTGPKNRQTLEVTINRVWLDDPARVFPVRLDPALTTTSAAVQDTWVRSCSPDSPPGVDGWGIDWRTLLQVGGGDGDCDRAAFIQWDVSQFHRGRIYNAAITLNNTRSYSCNSDTPIRMFTVLGDWDENTLTYNTQPDILWEELAGRHFANYAEGWCAQPDNFVVYDGESITNVVRNWVDYGPFGTNHGVTLRVNAPWDEGDYVNGIPRDVHSFKQFTSINGGGPANLTVMWSPDVPEYQPRLSGTWDAAAWRQMPTATQEGILPIRITNHGNATWSAQRTPEGVQHFAGYHLLDPVTWQYRKAAANLTPLPHDVPPGASVHVDLRVEPLPPGQHLMALDMVSTNAIFPIWMWWDQGSPTALVGVAPHDMLPTFNSLAPAGELTLNTPVLTAAAVNPDNWPNSPLTYRFDICTDEAMTANCQSSPVLADAAWSSPPLRWGTHHWWRATAFQGGGAGSRPSEVVPLLATPSQDPPLQYGANPHSSDVEGVNPAIGNYSRSVTDLSVAGVGPALDVARTYNSLDVTDRWFGVGWTGPWDSKLTVETGNTVLIRFADGHTERFGANADGSHSPPSGRTTRLVKINATDYVLTLNDGSTLLFKTNVTGRLVEIADPQQHKTVLTYDGSGRPIKVSNMVTPVAGQAAVASRSLSVAWTGNHVASVTTDPVTDAQTQATAPIAVSYTYDASGRLTSVCGPRTGPDCPRDTGGRCVQGAAAVCTRYDYEPGGRLDKITLPRGNIYAKLGYNADGTVAWVENGVGNRRTFTDDRGSMAGLFHPMTTARLLAPYDPGGVGIFSNGHSRTLQVTGVKGVPAASRVSAVAINIEAGTVGSDGFLRVYRADETPPPTTTIGLTAGMNNNQLHLVAVDAEGRIKIDSTLFNGGTVQIYVDVVGWFGKKGDSGGSSYRPSGGARLLDTRTTGARFMAGETRTVPVTGQANVPANATAVMADIKVLDPNGAGWMKVWPNGPSEPEVGSHVQYVANKPRDSQVLVGIGTGGAIKLRSHGPTTHLVIDVVGWFAPATSGRDGAVFAPTTPTRDIHSSTNPGIQQGPYNTPWQGGAPARVVSLADEQRIRDAVRPWFENTGTLPVAVAAGVVGTITAMRPTATTEIRAYPAYTNPPASTALMAAGGIVSSNSLHGYQLSRSGELMISSTVGSAELIVDTTGYFVYPAVDVTVTSPRGKASVFKYDPNGRLIVHLDETRPNDSVNREFWYNDAGFVYWIWDETGRWTWLEYDQRGNVTYRKSWDPSDKTWEDWETTWYEYEVYPDTDPRNGRLKAVRDARSTRDDYGETSDNRYRTVYTYNTDGTRATVLRPDGQVSRWTYTKAGDVGTDGLLVPVGLVRTAIDGAGNTTSYDYDAKGNLTRVTNPAGAKVEYKYDQLGRAIETKEISTSFASGVTTKTAYDASSRVVRREGTPMTDPISAKTHTLVETTWYDLNGNVFIVSASDAQSWDAQRTSAASYDNADRLVDSVDPVGTLTRRIYDADSNVVQTCTGGTATSPCSATARNLVMTYTDRNQLETTSLKNFAADPIGAPASVADILLESRVYDAAGRVKSVTNARGNVTRLDWVNENQLAKATLDPADQTIADTVLTENRYDGAGLLLEAKSAGGTRRATYTYDNSGRQKTSTADPGGRNVTTERTYLPNDLVQSVKATEGTRTEQTDYTYTPLGKPATVSVRNGATSLVTSYGYDNRGLATTVTSPRGITSYATYDALGRLSTTKAPNITVENYGAGPVTTQPMTTFAYNTFGDQVGVKDAKGRVTTSAVDQLGRAVSTTYPTYTTPAGNSITPTSSQVFDALGNVRSSTDRRGATTTFDYDIRGRLKRQTDPVPAPGKPAPVTVYGYDDNSNLTTVQLPSGATEMYFYDERDRRGATFVPERYADPGTMAWYFSRTEYDLASNVTRSTDASGRSTSFEYDGLNMVKSVKDPANFQTRFEYTLGHQKKATDPEGRQRVTRYDGAGRADEVQTLSPANAVLSTTSYALDADGNITGVTDPMGTTSTRTLDALGRTTASDQPATATRAIHRTFGYDEVGNPTRSTDGNGQTTWQTYNAWDQVQTVVEPTTPATPNLADVSWTTTYDAGGLPITLGKPGGVSTSTTYDALGRPTIERGSGAEATTIDKTFDYDVGGRLTSISRPGGTISVAYNDRDLVRSVTDTTTTSYTYDPDGRPLTRTNQTGTATFDYDTRGLLRTAADPLAGVTGTFTYKPGGQVDLVSYGAGNVSKDYDYDDLGRLKSEAVVNGSNTLTKSAYTYDANGNTLTKTVSPATVAGAGTNTYTYDKADRITSWKNPANFTTNYTWDDNSNRLTAGTSTFTYDARNRLNTSTTAGTTTTYGWTKRGTLSSKQVGAAEAVTSTFDAFDRTITDGTSTYTYDGLDRIRSRGGVSMSWLGLSQELTSDGTTQFSQDVTGQTIAQKTGTAPGSMLAANSHGDIVGSMPATATSLATSKAYDPWGKVLGTTGGTQPSLGYQGDWTDPGTGKVDMNARLYDPETAMFTARDSVDDPGMGNRYGYTPANPLRYTDPTGHCSELGPFHTPWGTFGPWFGDSTCNRPEPVRAQPFYGNPWGSPEPPPPPPPTPVKAEPRYGTPFPAPQARRSAGGSGATRSVPSPRPAPPAYNPATQPNLIQRPGQPGYGTAGAVTWGGGPANISFPNPAGNLDGYRNGPPIIFAAAIPDAPPAANVAITHDSAAGPPTTVAATPPSDFGSFLSPLLGNAHSVRAEGALGAWDSLWNLGEAAVGVGAMGWCSNGGFLVARDQCRGRTAWEVGTAIAKDPSEFAKEIGKGLVNWDYCAENGVARCAGYFVPDVIATVATAGTGKGIRAGAEATEQRSEAALWALMKEGAEQAGETVTKAGSRVNPNVLKACMRSFGPATPVLMSDGTRKPIAEIEEGDYVYATDPDTGDAGPREVIATLPHTDQLLTLRTSSGEILTTEDHKFWNETDHEWQESQDLIEGDELLTADGDEVLVEGLDWTTVHTAPAYDLDVADLDTFYVGAGDDEVLVHNCNTNPFKGPVDEPVFVADRNGNIINLKPGEYLTGSPDSTWLQVRDASGKFTGVRFDGGHSPKTHKDPRALGPHVHVPGVTNPDGTPWLPKK